MLLWLLKAVSSELALVLLYNYNQYVYYVESRFGWTHVTIVTYVSLSNSNVSVHEKQ